MPNERLGYYRSPANILFAIDCESDSLYAREARIVGDKLELMPGAPRYALQSLQNYAKVADVDGVLLEDTGAAKRLDPAGEWPPKPGDRVLLRSGGMQMTVDYQADVRVWCCWHDADGRPQSQVYLLDCLQRAPSAT